MIIKIKALKKLLKIDVQSLKSFNYVKATFVKASDA